MKAILRSQTNSNVDCSAKHKEYYLCPGELGGEMFKLLASQGIVRLKDDSKGEVSQRINVAYSAICGHCEMLLEKNVVAAHAFTVKHKGLDRRLMNGMLMVIGKQKCMICETQIHDMFNFGLDDVVVLYTENSFMYRSHLLSSNQLGAAGVGWRMEN